MLQEIYGADKRKKGADLLLLGALLAAVIGLRVLINLLAETVPTGISTGIVFAIVVAASFLIYKYRLCEYGYTFYYEEPSPDEVDAFGAPVKLPFETGTFIASRLSGGKPKVNELTHVRDVVALLAPDDAEYPDKCRAVVMAPGSRKTAYRLITRQDGKLCAWYIRPSENMLALLNEALDAKKRAEAE